MKTKKIELDVDFIGGQGPLNLDEEKALSEFFKQRKLTSNKASANKGQKKAKSPNVNV